MNRPYKKIMLVTNEPSDARGAEETALVLAKAHGSELFLIDSIRTPFHAPRFPSLTTEMMYEAAFSSKQGYLGELKTRFESEGVKTASEVIFGPRTSADIIDKVIANDVDLVIRYMKGQSSRADGRFGETAENLMRACPVPVLLTEKPISNPTVLACINLDHGQDENQAIVESAKQLASSPQDLQVLCCWEFAGEEFMYDCMDEALLEQSKEESEQVYQRLFTDLKSEYALDGLANQTHLISGNPTKLIPTFARENNIDIAVMCSSSLNHPLGRSLGSTIERTIAKLPCGLLSVKPIGFEHAPKNEMAMKVSGTT